MWDNNGSLTNNGKFTFTYNHAGRMTRAQGITATQVYTYNGDGLLMNRNGARYVWDQAAGLPQMLSDGSTLYVPGVGQWSSAAGWAYELADGLGSVRQLSDASGNIVQSYTYAPFGELIAAQGTRSSALRFTGEQTDDDTGLVYLRARWYDSATGRFTTRDPFPGFVALPQTLHPYIYAVNNPINVTDPSGEIIETPWDALMVGLDLLFLGWDYLYYDVLNPCLDRNERNIAINTDWAVLAFDLGMLATPGGPAGSGLLTRLLGRGSVVVEVVTHASSAVRTGQSVAKGVQAGTHLAEASGSSGGGNTRGNSVEWTPYGGRHIPKKGLTWKQTIESTLSGPAKYKPGINIEQLERSVWASGKPVASGRPWKVQEFKEVIGAIKGKVTRWVRVEYTSGVIHGHPITEAEYKDLLR